VIGRAIRPLGRIAVADTSRLTNAGARSTSKTRSDGAEWLTGREMDRT